MAKRRKTKRQKVVSDSRHLVSDIRLSQSQDSPAQTSTQNNQLYTFEDIKGVQKPNSQQIISVFDYQYLLHDIRKITLITTLIILTELGIFWTSNGF